MTIDELKAKLKSDSLCGCFLFAGKEDYLKKYYLGSFRERILTDEAFEPFNHAVFDGPDVSLAEIQDAIKSPPMMADGKLIEWRYPSFEKMKREEELASLEKTFAMLSQYDYATLVILVADGEVDLGRPKRPSQFVKRFAKLVNIVDFPISGDAPLAAWLRQHFQKEGVSADADVCRALIFRSGHSMTVLNNEVIKLSAYAISRGKASVSVEDVAEVASSTPESDTFALSNAILEKNKKAAYDALYEMKQKRADPLMIIGMLSKTFSELAVVTAMLSDGMGASDISAETGISGYPLTKYINAAKGISRARAAKVLAELSRVDTEAKFGGITGYTAIEIFIAKCV